MGMLSGNSCTLMVMAVILAVYLAQGATADELGQMAAFLNALGDNLALLAIQANSCPSGGSKQNDLSGLSVVPV